MFQPTLDQLRGVSLQAALRLALATATKTEDEIAAAMGWSPAQQARFFRSHDYWPSLPNIPRFCAVMGNTVLPLWVIANTEFCETRSTPVDAAALLRGLGQMLTEMGGLAQDATKALEDGSVDELEAKRMLRRLRDIFTAGYTLVPRLQASLDEGNGGSRV